MEAGIQPASLARAVHPGGDLSAQRKNDFLIQTKVSSGLALGLLPLYSYKAFHMDTSFDAPSNHCCVCGKQCGKDGHTLAQRSSVTCPGSQFK